MFVGRGDDAYARGIQDDSIINYNVFRPLRPLYDPDDTARKKPIAYEAFYLGTANKVGGGEIAKMRIDSSKQEIGVGDRLQAVERQELVTYMPKRPDAPIDARVIAMYDGVRYAGGGSIVTLSRGSNEGVSTGDVLQLYRTGETKLDRTANKREFIKLPDEQIGLAFVFRVFPGISYALIARGTRAVEVGDRATNPSDEVEFTREEDRMGITADPAQADAAGTARQRSGQHAAEITRHQYTWRTQMQAAERAAWLRLISTPGLGPRAARQLLSAFGLPQAIFDAGLSTLLRSMPEPLARVLAQPPSSEARSAIDATEHWLAAAPDHALLTLADSAYPQALLATADPPLVLFAIGRVELLNRPSLAIVGSRNATRQGSENAQLFARALAQAGITVASGLALGIDAAAHRGALAADSDASTIAVVGTGVDVTYPASNRTLTNDIRKRGVVISEFTLRTPAIAHNFPRRNRIIAGITRGTLVVEAALRSGSLITARLAADNGREVFAVPGSIHSPLSKGCHRLIRDGAKLVESAQDVLEEIGLAHRGAARADDVPVEPAAHADVLDLVGHDPIDLERLVEQSGREPGELVGALLELELAQHVERLPGNRYQRLR